MWSRLLIYLDTIFSRFPRGTQRTIHNSSIGVACSYFPLRFRLPFQVTILFSDACLKVRYPFKSSTTFAYWGRYVGIYLLPLAFEASRICDSEP